MNQIEIAEQTFNVNEDLRVRYTAYLLACGFDKTFVERLDGPAAYALATPILSAVRSRVYALGLPLVDETHYFYAITRLSLPEKKALRDKIISAACIAYTEKG